MSFLLHIRIIDDLPFVYTKEVEIIRGLQYKVDKIFKVQEGTRIPGSSRYSYFESEYDPPSFKHKKTHTILECSIHEYPPYQGGMNGSDGSIEEALQFLNSFVEINSFEEIKIQKENVVKIQSYEK